MMKKWIGLILCIALILTLVSSTAEETAAIDRSQGVVVTCYQDMINAVNGTESGQILLLVSPKYKYRKMKESGSLELADGVTVTIVPEQEGEEITIQESVRITGNGTVRFENVHIAAPDGLGGLTVSDGATVRIGSVTGGKGKTDGSTAVIVNNAALEIDTAVGGDGNTGMAGDGMIILGPSIVTIRDAAGGSAPQGFGGCGILIVGESKVTLTGSAKGGDGLYAAGQGLLTAWGSKPVEGDGTVTDGTLLEGQKKRDPEAITDFRALISAIRSGKTEIRLDPKFRYGKGIDGSISLIAFSDQPVHIIGNPEGKHVQMECKMSVMNGTWILDGVDIISNARRNDYCVVVQWRTKITINGNVTTAGQGAILCVGEAELNGIAQCNNAQTTAIAALGGGSIRMNGDLVMPTDYNAVYAMNGNVEINGNVTGKGNKEYPLLWMDGESNLKVTGDVSVTGDTNLINVRGGKAEITGTVTGKSNKKLPLIMVSGGELDINGPVESAGLVLESTGGVVRVRGDVTSKQGVKTYAVAIFGEGEITLYGDLIHYSGAALVKDGGTLKISGDFRNMSSLANVTHTENGGTIEEISADE